MYQHHNWYGALLDYPVSKMVCIGGDYANHIRGIGGSTPKEPVLFTEPEATLCDLRQPLMIPFDMGSARHEIELAVLIGTTLRQATEEHVRKAIADYGVALDLVLCDIQDKTKKAGRPWEEAKGFNNPHPLSGFTPVAEFNGDPRDTMLGSAVNGELRQHGTTADMIHHIVPLIAYTSRFFTLKADNVVLTGAPAGVGPLNSDDEPAISFHDQTLTAHMP